MSLKITERIALQEFSYLEIEAGSLEELLEVSEAAKQAYADKLHVAPESIKVHSTPESKEYPTRLARQAAESFGKDRKNVFTEEMGMEEVCPICGSEMKQRKGKFGPFYGCSKYPNCKGTRDINGKDTSRR